MSAWRLFVVSFFAGLGWTALACGSSGDASFEVTRTIEGEGKVTSTPFGFECQGPMDCFQGP